MCVVVMRRPADLGPDSVEGGTVPSAGVNQVDPGRDGKVIGPRRKLPHTALLSGAAAAQPRELGAEGDKIGSLGWCCPGPAARGC